MLGSTRIKSSIFGTLGLLALGATLGGCQTQHTTRLTVMNESSSGMLVDVAMAGSEDFLFTDQLLDQGVSRAFTVDHGGVDGAQIEVGVRPSEFAEAAGQWLSFDADAGPWLLRIQGVPGNLRFLPTRDVTQIKPTDIGPARDNRLGAQPPVNPR